MGKSLSLHDSILREYILKHGGKIVKHTGDGVFAVFENNKALLCAFEIQRHLFQQDWGNLPPLRVRIALHTGDAEIRGEDYFGPEVNRTARILGAGWGGQILFTQEVLNSCIIPRNAEVKDYGFHLLKDLREPCQIYGLLHPDLPFKEFPPLNSLSRYPNNLPSQPTPFLDREKELEQISRLLKDPACRLLTLVGPGGAGKSRLSLQAGAEYVEEFPHGVYFVPLAPLTSSQLIIPTIADALKFQFYRSRDPKEQLLNYLKDKKMLLILDNFEHLMEGVGLVKEILERTTQLKLFVTSRERLNLRGEWVFELYGMEFPEEEVEEVGSYGAVQLFLEGARRVAPDFFLSSGEAPYVSRICQLVQGLPSGIELASSWVRMLTCKEIALEIEKSLDFLTGTLRDLPERQESLRAVFEHSWRLLSEEERKVLRRLSVFRGGFSREAAQEVTGASLSNLLSLVDKSLLRKKSPGRFEMLEVIRQYAEEKLKMEGEENQMRELHCVYYANFLKERHSLLLSKQEDTLKEIKGELENIRSGWEWAVEQGREKELDDQMDCLFLFYEIRGMFLEGEYMFGKAVERFRNKEKTNFLGKLLHHHAGFCFCLGLYEKARYLAEESLIIFKELNNPKALSSALNVLGNISATLGSYSEAKRFYEESLEIRRVLGDPYLIVSSLNNLGTLHMDLGEYEEAKQLFEESIKILQGLGDRWMMANALGNLGVVFFYLNEYEKAERNIQEALKIYKELEFLWGVSACLNNLGVIATVTGRYLEAERLFKESLEKKKKLGDRVGLVDSWTGLGDLYCKLGEYEESKKCYREALREAKEIGALNLGFGALVGLSILFTLAPGEETVREERKKKAFEILSFVVENPSCYFRVREKAQKALSELALSPDIKEKISEKVKGMSLENLIAEILSLLPDEKSLTHV